MTTLTPWALFLPDDTVTCHISSMLSLQKHAKINKFMAEMQN
jgi:hypothetical protein